jgi:hypothetical protein
MTDSKEINLRLLDFVGPLASVIKGLEQVYGAPYSPRPQEMVVSVINEMTVSFVPSPELLIWLALWVRLGEQARQEAAGK